MFERLASLDRRWVFLAMAIALAVGVLLPIKMKFQVSPMVRALYDEVETIEPGSRVLLSVDYDPASQPELEPFTRAVVRHLLRRNAKLVFITLWDKAPPLVHAIIDDIVVGEYIKGRGFFEATPHPSYAYGTDYAYLGFKEGKQIVIAGLGQDLTQVYPTDSAGTPLERLPVMAGIGALKDFRLIVNPSAGFPGAKEYVQQVVKRYNLRYAAATTAVSVTDLMPYHPEQIFSLIAGMRGSAEYEQLMGYAGIGTAGLNALTWGQLVVIAFIVFGNAIYFVARRENPGAR